MVGQLALDQRIGVRFLAGEPLSLCYRSVGVGEAVEFVEIPAPIAEALELYTYFVNIEEAPTILYEFRGLAGAGKTYNLVALAKEVHAVSPDAKIAVVICAPDGGTARFLARDIEEELLGQKNTVILTNEDHRRLMSMELDVVLVDNAQILLGRGSFADLLLGRLRGRNGPRLLASFSNKAVRWGHPSLWNYRLVVSTSVMDNPSFDEAEKVFIHRMTTQGYR